MTRRLPGSSSLSDGDLTFHRHDAGQDAQRTHQDHQGTPDWNPDAGEISDLAGSWWGSVSLSPVRSFVWLVLLVQGVLEFPYLYLIKKVPTPPKSPVTVKEIILTQTYCFFHICISFSSSFIDKHYKKTSRWMFKPNIYRMNSEYNVHLFTFPQREETALLRDALLNCEACKPGRGNRLGR